MDIVDEDEALIAAALRGSAYAWEKLVKHHESRIYNLGLRLTGNSSDAMDLTQEVFLGVYRNLHRFRGDAKFSSWLFRIAHNKAVDLNRRKRFLTTGGSFIGDEPALDSYPDDGSDEPDCRLLQQQHNDRIRSMLSQLPFDQRLVVELKIYHSQTFEEIAQMQDISENTAKTRFYTALRKLKTRMEETHDLS
ncbi:MAG: RNA polymerase sigma factor [Gammaproteobacteria bacterium]|nr:RNA polymerase sigma factor [Gammaproteobacteria bacterium]MCY4358113.1 RNA polymerase sigma factor [Gammaproteobacteria bacterium]